MSDPKLSDFYVTPHARSGGWIERFHGGGFDSADPAPPMLDGSYIVPRSTVRRLLESGPGIASMRPDTSVAFLDEDLLCEDA
jgi:hypothetical protein